MNRFKNGYYPLDRTKHNGMRMETKNNGGTSTMAGRVVLGTGKGQFVFQLALRNRDRRPG